MFKRIIPAAIAVLALATSCNNADQKSAALKEPVLKEENVTFTADSVTMNGYVVYDENIEGARPGVIVVPEWWGFNEYARMRARELAKLGYIALAMDIYGNNAQADNPDTAGKLAGPFYQHPEIAKPRFEAALAKLRTYAQTDSTKLGAIGYCFGGAQVINMAKMGEPLAGVVSFHGNLNVVTPQKDMTKAEILVCHGAADPFVPQAEADKFKKQMDSVGAKYTFKAYDSAMHAFTNPNATALGEKFNLAIKYNAAADTASWEDMKTFFKRVFNK